MDSENEDEQPGFAKQGGDAMGFDDDDGDFAENDSEEVDQDDDEDMIDPEPAKKGSGSKAPIGPPKDVKGEKLDN